LAACALLFVAQSRAQSSDGTVWMNPFKEGAETHGQGWSELRQGFFRLPEKAKDIVRPDVWGLSRSSAGLSLVFTSNAENISVRYQVTGGFAMYHMPSTGVSGVDLYARDEAGKLRWCSVSEVPSFKDTVNYKYNGLTYYPDGAGCYEYHLYLPMYNSVKWLEIGVNEGAEIEFKKESTLKPIVIYGTSITQGACASRPGNAWTNIIERELNRPVVNLGFSGNGRLEPELFDLLAEIDASMYIIDCMPNMHIDNPVADLAVSGVKKLREKHDCPIVLVEHSGYSGEVTRQSLSVYRELNKLLRDGYDAIVAAGIPDVYYLPHDEMWFGMDGMVETGHPNDLGMRRFADGCESIIRKVENNR